MYWMYRYVLNSLSYSFCISKLMVGMETCRFLEFIRPEWHQSLKKKIAYESSEGGLPSQHRQLSSLERTKLKKGWQTRSVFLETQKVPPNYTQNIVGWEQHPFICWAYCWPHNGGRGHSWAVGFSVEITRVNDFSKKKRRHILHRKGTSGLRY